MNISTSTLLRGVMGGALMGAVVSLKIVKVHGMFCKQSDDCGYLLQTVQSKCSKENGFYKNFN